MNTDMDSSNTDEYYVTALQIFDYCGAENSGKLRVDALMDKFAPFIKTNKAEYSYLKSLLDPNQENPEISVTKLASALHKYSESQKCKVDLDESFNLRCGQAPQDSDSGISTDGFQLLEELQCELREKTHLAHQLRSQLDFTDRQHEEVLATLTAERDSLRAHLNMLREENMTLSHVRRDYEDACDRLLAAERALNDVRGELDAYRKRDKVLQEQVATLEMEKLSLQELLRSSKDECHHMNEMYASRQSALLLQNETLKTEHADLSSRLQDQDEFLQQLIKEKVLLEMELKDLLNKSNHTQLRMDRSIDISYTEDQMLTALDSLNADSRFSQDNCLLDEESFANALKEDQGRATNMSLFDEIRLSFSNMSRHNLSDNLSPCACKALDSSATETQTDIEVNDLSRRALDFNDTGMQTEDLGLAWSDFNDIGTQTEAVELACTFDNDTGTQTGNIRLTCDNSKDTEMQTEYIRLTSDCLDSENVYTQTEDTANAYGLNLANIYTQTEDIELACECLDSANVYTQTDDLELACDCLDSAKGYTQTEVNNNNDLETCIDCAKCSQCETYKRNIEILETDKKYTQSVINETQDELSKYEDNLNKLQKMVSDCNGRNSFLHAIVDSLESKIMGLEATCVSQREIINSFSCDMCCVQSQTDSDVHSVGTQVETACDACEKRGATPTRNIRRYFWDAVKCMFQAFAVLCFAAAVCVLYGLSRPRAACPAPRPHTPWRWLHAQDLLDLLLRIDYVADVPM